MQSLKDPEKKREKRARKIVVVIFRLVEETETHILVGLLLLCEVVSDFLFAVLRRCWWVGRGRCGESLREGGGHFGGRILGGSSWNRVNE